MAGMPAVVARDDQESIAGEICLPRLLTVREVARPILQVSESRVFELVRLKILPAVKLGRQVRIHPAALSQFIENGGAELAVRPRTAASDANHRPAGRRPSQRSRPARGGAKP